MFFYFKKLFQAWFRKSVYLDHASTTPIDLRVFSHMRKIFRRSYGNPGGLYPLATRTREIITASRKTVAGIVGVAPEQIIFTRGGTESNNLAILGVIRRFQKNYPGIIPHIITSTIEHDSVLQVIKKMETDGELVATYIPCNAQGIIEVGEIKKQLRPETVLISIMYANNEIGTIQPIAEIAKLIRWWKKHAPTPLFSHEKITYPLLHTDAIQAANYCDMFLPRLGIDLTSLSGSKIYGPKSVGVLFVKQREMIDPIFFGGNQEFTMRPGTEDVAMIAGFTKALQITNQIKEQEVARLTQLRDDLITELLTDERVTLNGSRDVRLPNNINVTIAGFSGEQLVIQLAAYGFAVSAKSACQSDNDEESHVIAALRTAEGLTSNTQEGSLRITLGRGTTKSDTIRFLKAFRKLTSI